MAIHCQAGTRQCIKMIQTKEQLMAFSSGMQDKRRSTKGSCLEGLMGNPTVLQPNSCRD